MSPTPNEFSRINFNSPAPEEYGQVDPADTYPDAGLDQVPSEGAPKELQISRDKASTPAAMASETDGSQNAFSDLQQFLNNNLEVAGSRVCNPQSKPYRPPHGSEGE